MRLNRLKENISNTDIKKLNEVKIELSFTSNDSYILFVFDEDYAQSTNDVITTSDEVMYGYSSDSINNTGTEIPIHDTTLIKKDSTKDIVITLPKKQHIQYIDGSTSGITINYIFDVGGMTSLNTFICREYNFYSLMWLDSPLVKITNVGEQSKIIPYQLSNSLEYLDVGSYDVINGNLSGFNNKYNLRYLHQYLGQNKTSITGNISSIPTNNIEYISLRRQTAITGSIEHFNNSGIKNLLINFCSGISGSINNMPKTLIEIELYGTQCTGDIKTLAENQIAGDNPRTSGTLTVQCNGLITNDGVVVTDGESRTITFTENGYSIA